MSFRQERECLAVIQDKENPMRMAFLLGKLATLAFWLVVLGSLIDVIAVPDPQRLNWIALVVLAVHLIEWLLVRAQLNKLGEPLQQFLLVMLFGVFHIKAPATRKALFQAL